MPRKRAPQTKQLPGARQKSKLGLPYSSELAPGFCPAILCLKYLIQMLLKVFQSFYGRAKNPERAGRNMEVLGLIVAGLLVLIFDAGLACVAF